MSKQGSEVKSIPSQGSSIRDLISIFESGGQRGSQVKKEPPRPRIHSIAFPKIFSNFQENRQTVDTKITKETQPLKDCELERIVSVKSLVYNFQQQSQRTSSLPQKKSSPPLGTKSVKQLPPSAKSAPASVKSALASAISPPVSTKSPPISTKSPPTSTKSPPISTKSPVTSTESNITTSPSPVKQKVSQAKVETSPLIQQSQIVFRDSKGSLSTDLFSMEPISILQESQVSADESEASVSSDGEELKSRTYTFGNLEKESDDVDPTVDSIKSIIDDYVDEKKVTKLPDSYRLLKSQPGKLTLELPPPPRKTNIKKASPKKKKTVKFVEKVEEGEVYGQYEYQRADEYLDVETASNTYELEKSIEEMEKIQVTINKKPAEKFGLSVYGLSLNTHNTNDFMAIYVRTVAPGSLCERCNKIKVDDLIIEINGISMIGVEVTAVQKVILGGGDTINILLARKRNT